MKSDKGGPTFSLDELIEDIRQLVTIETPSSDYSAVRRGAIAVAALGERLLGRSPQLLELGGVTHVLWPSTSEDSMLLLGHQDTVWPSGTLERRPFGIEDGHLRGPGVFDMKTGVVMMLHAVRALPPELQRRVTILVTGDEETGSSTSRALIERLARSASAALVAEGAADDGALKVARKGASIIYLDVRGVASHAGLEPWRGSNATVELAACIREILPMANDNAGTTVTPTVIEGGSSLNTVPDRARLGIDVRAWSLDEQRRVEAALRSLTPHVAGTEIEVSAQHSPPMEETMAEGLNVLAEQAAAALGIVLPAASRVGGASDANFVGGAGTPVLDGLGAVGGGAHADNEYVQVDQIVPRTTLLSELVRRFLTGSPFVGGPA